MMGVLYQFVPALTKRPASWPGGALWQVLLFAIGSFGMIVSFWFGRLEDAAWSATAVEHRSFPDGARRWSSSCSTRALSQSPRAC
jgi:hypothetical protein